ncbi:DNA polymerase-3 subunit gamma/tau [Devosia enhydra]|uniref:DNA polymerase III subunit gamma/tau n=1 Tax=Devosia enhydra TaxID=665118 RepID=A0A1K2I267_9HYPH|nr:DNA polymerase III subunit gamma/tau [Devosia enhydra]SFZ86424.1 DNA polymerase-3 subunit gamma/tau [Devosia enhydra]
MATPEAPKSPYLVLARKYRPQDFSTLIGQEPMVRTLQNAFRSGRIHHAFILTGVRGVGKTTTARILARAFNYEDDAGRRPTLELEREGLHCRAIIEGSHVDVQEMDAASNTGIDSIREINAMTRTPPMSAPYKVFIIDEVHMLSNSAFNGLLKTLEEPPPYVKFIFATTEIRKVPVTILSRCMRFDLRRVTPEVMTGHLETLLGREGLSFEPEALSMIVRAGEGSVRDNLSLLDQAISHGDGAVTATTVKAMLGLGDRARTIDLFEALMAGDAGAALAGLRDLYDAGADPQTVIADLCDFTHLVTRIKVVPATAEDPALTPDEQARGAELAGRLGMRALSRAWQILFKGHEEVSRAGNAVQAAEMVLVRLAYAADLPSPEEVITKLQGQPLPSGGGGAGGGAGASLSRGAPQAVQARFAPQASPDMAPQAVAPSLPSPRSYAELVALAGEKRDILLKLALEGALHPIAFADGRIEVALAQGADPGVVQMLSARLKAWTGRQWMVTVSNTAPAAPTIRQQREAVQKKEEATAQQDPLVQAILDTFPGATMRVHLRQEAPPLEAYADIVPDGDRLPDDEDDDE